MTDQEKQEKVIAELERVADEANPWKESPPLRCDISYPLLIDALALLKAQEPRVMTPDEVTNAPEKSVIWLELKPDDVFKNEIYPFVGSGKGWYSCYCSANTSPMFTDEDVEQYGVAFRCWTSRPTDEQREAEPWE